MKDGIFNGENIISNDKTNYENAIYAFYKVLEHTKLAYAQYQSLYQKTELEVQELYNTSQKSIEEYKKLKNTARELKRNYNNFNVEIISVLGIFASIIFAVFGGVSQLGNLGSSLKDLSLSRIFIYIGATSFVLFSVVFMAFNATALLTDRDMRACGCIGKDDCNHGLAEKYPVYLYSSVIALIIFFLGIIVEVYK